MKILARLYTIVLAIIIVVGVAFATVSLRLPQKEVYESALDSVSFAPKLDELVSGGSIEDIDYDKVLTFLVFDITTNQLTSRDWIEGVIDQNLDLYVDWMGGENGRWQAYIPVQDINSELEKSLNSELLEILDENRSQVRVCSATREKEVEQNGIAVGEDFCVPLRVRDGEVTYTTFLGDDDGNLLGKIYVDSVFERLDGIFEVAEVTSWEQWDQDLSLIRSIARFFQRSVVAIFLIVLVTILLDLLWVYYRKEPVLSEVRNLLFLSGVFGLLGMTVVIMFFGMSDYLAMRLQESILPQFATVDLIELLSSWLYQVILELVLPLYWYFAGFLLISIIILVVQKMRLFETTAQKNDRIERKQSFSGQTLDSNFHAELKKENMLRSFGGNPILHQYDQEKKQKELQAKLAKARELTQNSTSPQPQDQINSQVQLSRDHLQQLDTSPKREEVGGQGLGGVTTKNSPQEHQSKEDSNEQPPKPLIDVGRKGPSIVKGF